MIKYEKKDLTAGVPRPLERAGRGAAEQTLFRGEPILWVTVPTAKTVVTENAFGDSEASERPGRKNHFILYGGNQYKREEFYQMAFPWVYRKYPYKVIFATDDIYRLGGSQRAKLQYHILAQQFPLVYVDEQDKADLEAFAAQSETEAAQLWLARMRWPQGHEKMVTFGQNIGVEDKASGGRVKGLWCYTADMDAVRAIYTGYAMTWEIWVCPLVDYLMGQREARTAAALEVIQTVMRLLYYQNGLYLTVPGNVRREIVKWAYQYLRDGAAPFPFTGDMGSDNYQFTINFERDTSLKENVNIHADMGAYNAAHNAEKAAHRTLKRFADLTGERWTTAELHAQGFSDRNIKTFCKSAN